MSKNSFACSKSRFVDMSWRLDIELARRNMNVMTEPKFLLRIGVTVPEKMVKEGPQVVKSINLQSDYANLKNVQLELERALSDLSGTHSSRLTRYII